MIWISGAPTVLLKMQLTTIRPCLNVRHLWQISWTWNNIQGDSILDWQPTIAVDVKGGWELFGSYTWQSTFFHGLLCNFLSRLCLSTSVAHSGHNSKKHFTHTVLRENRKTFCLLKTENGPWSRWSSISYTDYPFTVTVSFFSDLSPLALWQNFLWQITSDCICGIYFFNQWAYSLFLAGQ